jgi:hypothetical protein
MQKFHRGGRIRPVAADCGFIAYKRLKAIDNMKFMMQ